MMEDMGGQLLGKTDLVIGTNDIFYFTMLQPNVLSSEPQYLSTEQSSEFLLNAGLICNKICLISDFIMNERDNFVSFIEMWLSTEGGFPTWKYAHLGFVHGKEMAAIF